MLYDMRWDEAGNLGQVSMGKPGEMFERGRFLFWTEDSRLHTVADDDNYSYYAYDYAGERTLKLTGDVSVLENNAERMWVSSALKQLVMYPSPYITITDKGYTKHYYAGSELVCASIGGGMLAAATQNSDMLDRANDLLSSCIEQNSDRVLSTNNNDCLLGLVYNEEPLHVLIKGVPQKLAASINTDLSMFIAKMSYLSAHSDPENDVYFYHADHLGSASWITDKNGVPVQHLQYLPYGERFVDQHTSGYEERYTFTGKEKDSETGYYAFGARYYDCDLSGIFLSVDPMSDKYPSISPYHYCSWNPIKKIDPTGKDDYEVNKQGYIIKCKDQSHAIKGQDRLFTKPLIGHVKFNKNGVTNRKYVSVKEGVLSLYSGGSIGRQESRQMLFDESILYNGTKIMLGNCEDKTVELFEFLSKHTNVEWTMTAAGNSETRVFALTTSHMAHNEYFGTDMADKLDALGILLYQFHNHHNSLGASEDDKNVQKRNTNSGAMFGYYRPDLGYYDFNNIIITDLPWKRKK